ncbi:MAG: SGNH/GDSL hydrolase family protein [Nitrospirae bacterium YQR-1]
MEFPGWKNVAAVLVGCVVAAIVFEVFLRVYNPVHFTVRGDNITLAANETIHIENKDIPNIDKLIKVWRNSIGFRGADPPVGLDGYLSIISAGGSTTECLFLSDGKTWTDLLANKLKKNFHPLWINNAGISGHSSYGHYILIQSYISKIHPKVVLFLVGANEIQKSETHPNERAIMQKHDSTYNFKTFVNYLASKTETVYFLQNINRFRQAAKAHLYTEPFDVRTENTLSLPDMAKEVRQAKAENAAALSAYEQRLHRLIDITVNSSIVPVLITQPVLYGNAIDNSTGKDLGKLKFAGNYNGELWWNIMEMYNDVTRKTASERNVFIIDLSKELHKDSRYYYDWLHFTNTGAQQVSEILYKHLCPFLSEKYPELNIGKCL